MGMACSLIAANTFPTKFIPLWEMGELSFLRIPGSQWKEVPTMGLLPGPLARSLQEFGSRLVCHVSPRCCVVAF